MNVRTPLVIYREGVARNQAALGAETGLCNMHKSMLEGQQLEKCSSFICCSNDPLYKLPNIVVQSDRKHARLGA